MHTIGRFVDSMSSVLDFNQATLSGCVDVVVVRQPDGSLKSTPFHVRFGKLKVLKSKNRDVKIYVNSEESNLKMKLGSAGEGFFEVESFEHAKQPLLPQRVKLEVDQTHTMSKSESDDRNLRSNHNLVEMLRLRSNMSSNSTATRATNSNDNSQISYQEELPVSTDEKKIKYISTFSDEMVMGNDKKLQQIENLPSSQHEIYKKQPLNSAHHNDIEKPCSKTLRPSTGQLESLNLKQGVNTITYMIKSKLQGRQEVTGHIYLWSHDANIIISDVDGTITKSDVMGHLMSMVGRDWSQPGIAPLYTNIRRNGYHILYLTSRAIGQAKQTKDFVYSIYQDGKMLPHGPMITSPDRMLSSVKREVIYKRPELFKMAVLKDIRSLFPANHNPFHAGFGNRESDAIAYNSVGIPLDKVFIVNASGNIHHHNHGCAKSYAIINTMIKDMFPGVLRNSRSSLIEKVNEENILEINDQRMMSANLIKVIS